MAENDEVTVEKDVMVPMRDGIRLRADVFRPAVPGPHPVLVQRYPYSNRDGYMAIMGQMIAAQGYAVVVQSCRGRYGSEGDFYPFQPDVEDSYDTVEWAAAQPWSNGKVGMYGASYSGLTQWTAAIARPPHLVCITPFTCPWDWADSGWYYAPGVMTLGLALIWSAQMTAYEAERRGVTPPLPEVAEAASLLEGGGSDFMELIAKAFDLQTSAVRPLFERRPLRDIEELRDLAPWFRDWCDHDDQQDQYWRRTSAARHMEQIELPILHLAGWYDYFARGGIEAFVTMHRYGVTEQTRRGQRLVIGPWNHNSAQVRPDADPNAGIFFDFSPGAPVMRFFAHHLKGEFGGYDDEAPIRLYVMGENTWRDEYEWPLSRTHWASYYLGSTHGHRSLGTDPPGQEGPDSFVYDPTDPVPGPVAIGFTFNDPVDLEAIAARPDVLVYTTSPLVEELEITGPVTLELWASSSVENTDFTAKLIDVFPDGRAIHLCQGIVRTGVGVARPRTPGAAYCYDIDLWATSVVLKKGHRIRLDVSSSEYPTYDLNPNTGRRITADAGVVAATQTVFHDELHPSRLILPVIPR